MIDWSPAKHHNHHARSYKWDNGWFWFFFFCKVRNAGLEIATITVIVVIPMHATSNGTTGVLSFFLPGLGWKLQPTQFEMGLTLSVLWLENSHLLQNCDYFKKCLEKRIPLILFQFPNTEQKCLCSCQVGVFSLKCNFFSRLFPCLNKDIHNLISMNLNEKLFPKLWN